MINSLAHVHGSQRYVTGDDSRNNFWLALVTLGEGWHNNHHAYQRSTRQGFRWWEVDVTFYLLRVASWFRLVWDLGEPPADLVRNERPVGRAVVERVARQLAAHFPTETIAAQIRDQLAHSPRLEEFRRRAQSARAQAAQALAELHLPHVPSMEEIRQRARQTLADSPSLDEIASRARELVLEHVSLSLLPAEPA
jgi:stearoyl-CoA desaturase (Delta-9 desaturase)